MIELMKKKLVSTKKIDKYINNIKKSNLCYVIKHLINQNKGSAKNQLFSQSESNVK